MSEPTTLANIGTPVAPSLTPAPASAPAAAPATPPASAPSPTYEQRRYEQDRRAEEVPGEKPEPPSVADTQPPADAAQKVKVGKYEIDERSLGEMLQRQAQDDLRKAKTPPTPEAYKLEISPDAKLPGDIAVKFDGNDPGLIAAKTWAHGKGLDQGAFSEMLTLYASHVAQQEATFAARSRAEIEKAGVNAPQRVEAVSRWITAEIGEADARQVRATLVTDAHLRFYEKIISKLENQGVGSFSQRHRAAPNDESRIEGFDDMSFEQRRFAQDQLAARRGR